MSYINIEKVSKSYNKKDVLKDISFGMEKNEIIAILGPSGSGKTTLLKCILGLEHPDRGLITIDSKSHSDWLSKQRIAYVPQQYANFEYLTVRQNVALAAHDNLTLSSQEILNSLKSVGLHKYADHYPGSLSGGMQQRLALARALAQKTNIVAFDESLSALDVETRHQMQELILDIWVEKKKTFLFVTHDIEEALFLANRIVVMGTRPGSIQQILNIPFEYPRASNLRFDEQFQRLRKGLTFSIRSEMIKGRLVEGQTLKAGALKVGLYIWPGNSPFFYAQDQGLFDKRGLSVELISFSDNREKIEYWKRKQIDILNVSMDTALRLKKQIPETEIISELVLSKGGDALVTREPLESVKQINGKKIALERGEIGEFFLNYVLHKNGLSLDDVILRDMKSDEIGTALINHAVDAAVLWEPWLSKTIELSGAHKLVTSKQYPVFMDVLVARKSFIKKNKKHIEQLKQVFEESVEVFKSDKNHFIRSVAPHVGLGTRELEAQLATLEFFKGSVVEVTRIMNEIRPFV